MSNENKQHAGVRVCAISDAECSRDCGAGACKKEAAPSASHRVQIDPNAAPLTLSVESQPDERAAFDLEGRCFAPGCHQWDGQRECTCARATKQATTGDERATISHKLHVPPRGDEEPTALLMYGEDQFEIGYTLMHWLVGVIATGAAKSGVAAQILENAKSAFSFVDSAMCWDANPPEQTGEHADMLRRVGYTLTRPTFKLPYPEVAEYEAGHTPKPFAQRAMHPRPVAGSAGQAPDVCEICKQPWSAHEMGVPAPYCPDVNDKD